MQFYVGTSAFQVKEWRGTFYPEKMPEKEMLAYYASRFPTVEINNTFYRMPTAAAVTGWRQQTVPEFRFAIKAPQSITHLKRLKEEATAPLEQFLETVAVLSDRLGALFFQLPPNFKKDLPRLEAFLKVLNNRAPAAFEFRHPTWRDDEVYQCLREHSCTLCLADTDELPVTDLVSTTDWGYVRLRKTNYTRPQLRKWVEKIQSQPWEQVFVYFMHEETGTGPKFAAQMLELIHP